MNLITFHAYANCNLLTNSDVRIIWNLKFAVVHDFKYCVNLSPLLTCANKINDMIQFNSWWYKE